jgi:hypothetical protein
MCCTQQVFSRSGARTHGRPGGPRKPLPEADRRCPSECNTRHPDLPAIARAEDVREHFKERAAILEFYGGLPVPWPSPKARGSRRLSRGTGATWGRPCGRRWRTILSCCLRRPRCPARWMLCLRGMAKLAVLKDKRVVRQEASPGAGGECALVASQKAPPRGGANPDFSPVVWKKAVPRGIICSGSTGYADIRGRPYEHRV